MKLALAGFLFTSGMLCGGVMGTIEPMWDTHKSISVRIEDTQYHDTVNMPPRIIPCGGVASTDYSYPSSVEKGDNVALRADEYGSVYATLTREYEARLLQGVREIVEPYQDLLHPSTVCWSNGQTSQQPDGTTRVLMDCRSRQ